MPSLSRRARLLALATLLAAAAGLLLVVWLRPPALRDSPALELPSVLPSIRERTPPPSGTQPSGTPAPEPEVLLAVGDIGSCDGTADEAVADLASRLPGTIAVLGDVVYEEGSPVEYRGCFEPAWGEMRSRMRPAAGNHEYRTDDAAGYFDYFGDAAGEPGRGWYSYDLGAWHVVVLNSNCEQVQCGPGSPQVEWLRSDLASREASSCLLAYWHHPRWSSGRHGSSDIVDLFWDEVRAAGADVVLNGHDHSYERLAVDGVRQFVVGTGGRSLYPFEKQPLPETETRSDASYGLLWLSLGEGTYDWEFLPLGRSGYSDAGSGSCS
jgi:hypothetical protein